MGVHKQHVTFRFAETTLKELDEIQRTLSPFAEDRSSTLRIIVKLMYALLFTPMTIKDLVHVLQRLQSDTSSHSQLWIQFPEIGIALRPRFGTAAAASSVEMNRV
jgi:hypothetical protein